VSFPNRWAWTLPSVKGLHEPQSGLRPRKKGKTLTAHSSRRGGGGGGINPVQNPTLAALKTERERRSAGESRQEKEICALGRNYALQVPIYAQKKNAMQGTIERNPTPGRHSLAIRRRGGISISGSRSQKALHKAREGENSTRADWPSDKENLWLVGERLTQKKHEKQIDDPGG